MLAETPIGSIEFREISRNSQIKLTIKNIQQIPMNTLCCDFAAAVRLQKVRGPGISCAARVEHGRARGARGSLYFPLFCLP